MHLPHKALPILSLKYEKFVNLDDKTIAPRPRFKTSFQMGETRETYAEWS